MKKAIHILAVITTIFYIVALAIGLLHEYAYYLFSEDSTIPLYLEPILDIANLPIIFIPAFLLSLTDLIYVQQKNVYSIILLIITGALVIWELLWNVFLPILFRLG